MADTKKGKWPTQRPLMPRLAASSPSSVKTPPAPKIAPHLASSATSSPRSTSRRPLTTASAGSSSVGRNVEQATPIRELDNSNITPRSSARRSRTGSAQSTPTGPTGPASASPRPLQAPSLSFAGRVASARPDPLVSERSESDLNRRGTSNNYATAPTTPSTPFTGSCVSQNARRSQENDDYFFHVDEAPKPRDSPQKPPLVSHKKTPSFVYANGVLNPSNDETEASNRKIPAANGTTTSSASKVTSGTTSSFPSYTPFPRNNNQPPRGASSPPRHIPPFNPQKPASNTANTHANSGQPRSPPPSTPSESPVVAQHHRARQTSLESSPNDRTRKALSLSSQSSTASSGNPKLAPPLYHSYTHHHQTNAAVTSYFPHQPTRDSPLASPPLHHLSKPSPAALDTSHRPPSDAFDQLHSPTSASGSAEGGQALGESAANARRERKVLDLEISNSSLLAINRSLEREMRKQKAEIRRLRRVTRNVSSQRYASLSTVASDIPATRLSSLGEANGAGVPPDSDDQDDGYSTEPEEASASDRDDLPDDEANSSAVALAQRDAKHRRSDRRRLQLDLERHRQLLADSQGMNQSLKRCLGVTDRLVAEGRRALAYQAETGDVLGCKVLSVGSDADEESEAREEGLMDGEGRSALGVEDGPVLEEVSFYEAGGEARPSTRDSSAQYWEVGGGEAVWERDGRDGNADAAAEERDMF